MRTSFAAQWDTYARRPFVATRPEKEQVKLAKWMKEFGPSAELRKSFGHDPAHWKEYRKRYKAELKRPETRAMLKELSKAAAAGTVTLVYSAKDEEHNQAVAISEVLGSRRNAPSRKFAQCEAVGQPDPQGPSNLSRAYFCEVRR